jgi:hypothetical protein
MKTRIIFTAALLAVIMSGCLVKSLHPFYNEKDVLYRPELLGRWVSGDSTDNKNFARWEISRHMVSDGFLKEKKPGNGYDIKFTDEKGSYKFLANLFMLNDQLYLDFYLSEMEASSLAIGHLVLAHTLARVKIEKDRVTISWYNEEWIMKLFNENRIRIAHERVPNDVDQKNPENYEVVLTAPTSELQQFILKYGNDPAAFDKKNGESDYTFVLKKVAK